MQLLGVRCDVHCASMHEHTVSSCLTRCMCAATTQLLLCAGSMGQKLEGSEHYRDSS
jgi:hypothetical protein